MTKQALFTIDVDPLLCYYDIHGLERPAVTQDTLLVTALPRMLHWLSNFDVKATLFVTTGELGDAEKAVIAQAAQNGHEIASHSFTHDYRLTTLSNDLIKDDLNKNSKEIEQITGSRPVGFRAPGYSMTPELYTILQESGFSYDASAFPSPFYYLAKWSLIHLKALLGKKSKSIISSFSEAFTKRTPSYHKKSALALLPITTVGLFGWPMLGTALIVFPRLFFNHLLKRAAKKEYFHFEAHAIDAADILDDDLLQPLLSLQPDLKKSVQHKEEAFSSMLKTLKEQGFQFVTASEYCKQWSENQK
ncbi:polysaccharide deacetylase family protein [bacterium]|nr:polysaccharide deacetylase family protein [bacterium]